jgi:nucleoside-diphosphate-sugar epimerase
MKKVLLTGGTGYLGRNLINGLTQQGYELVLLVRQTADISFLQEYTGSIKTYEIETSIIGKIFEEHQIDVVIHTAASYGRKGENMSQILQANLIYPTEILDAAIKNGVKYFINTDTALPKSLNGYARSKKQFLEWLESVSAQINVLNLQLEYFYGPNDDHSKFITYVLTELKSGKDHIDFTEATSFRDFIYIEDVVQAYLVLLSNLEIFKDIKTIEIGSGKAEMLKETIKKIQLLVDSPSVELNFGALPMRTNEIMHSCANIKFMKSIGWEPKYSFEEGILETIKNEKNWL